LVCERHTGVGLSEQEIIKQNLPIPKRDMLPISLKEEIICFADKFFTKYNPKEERKIEVVKNDLMRFGSDKVEKFDILLKKFY
jgi:uncharacterized protein